MRPVDSASSIYTLARQQPETEAAPPAVQTVQQEAPPPQAPTPAQRTDAAYAAYRDALRHREEAMRNAPANMHERTQTRLEEDAAVAKAKKALDAAVAAEIGPQVDAANHGVPGQYRRPTGELITSYGNVILQRHADDPAAQAALKASIGDYQLQRKADELIPGFYGDFSAKEKLTSLSQSLQGQPPEVIERVMADPRVQQWVKDAAAHIAEPYKGKDGDLSQAHDQALEASKRLAETVQGLSPELAAQVIAQSMPTIRQIAQLNPHGNIAPFIAVYSAMSRLGGGPQAQSLMTEAARAFVANPGYDSSVLIGPGSPIAGAAGFSNDPSFAIALADQLRTVGRAHEAELVLDAAAKGISDRLKYDVSSPKVLFDKAHQASVEKDKRLAELLAEAGPLTPEQQAAFIQAYRNDPQNQQVYKAEADAAKALADHLNANKDALLFAAGRSPEAAQQLYDSLKALKDAGQGRTALEFALAIQSDPNSAVAKAFDKFADFKTDFTQEAIAAASAQLLANHDGDPQGAFDELKALIDRYKPDWAISGVVGLKEGYEAIRQVISEGRYDRLNHITANFDKASPVLKGLAAAGIVFGAVSGANAANRGDYAEAVNRFAMAGSGSAKLLAAATKSLADAGKLAAYGDSALSFARFSSKLAPGLAIAANATAAVSDGGKLFGGDLSYFVSFVGDVVGVIGGALEFTPLAPAGLLLQGGGALLTVVGGIITGNAEEKAFQAEQNKYLEAAGIGNGNTRSALINSDPEQVKQLLALGLTPAQIQDLATSYPQLLESHHGYGPYVGELPKLQQRIGLNGDQLYQLLKAADANGEPGAGASGLLWVLGHPSWFPQVANAQSKADLIAAFEAQATQTSNPEQARALTQAAQWLRTH